MNGTFTQLPGTVQAVDIDREELLVELPDAYVVVGVSKWLDANKQEMPREARNQASWAEFELLGQTWEQNVAESNRGVAIIGNVPRQAETIH